MVHERQYIFLRLNLLIDMALAMLALVAAYYTRSLLAWLYVDYWLILPTWFPEIVPYEESHLLREYLWLFPACALLWPLALNRWGYYDLYDLRHTGARRWTVVKASAVCAVFLVSAIFVFKQQFIARIVLVGAVLWATALLIVKDAIIRAVFVRLHRRPDYQHNVLIVAQGGRVRTAEQLIDRYHEWGLRVTGKLEIDGLDPAALADQLTHSLIDEVVFSVEPSSFAGLSQLVNVCEQLGLKTRVFVDVYTPQICALTTEHLHGVPMLTLSPTTQNFGALTVKVFFDRVASAVLLLLLSPILIIIAAAIALTSKGPVIHKQIRCGINGKQFTIFKFRSMVENAADALPDLEAANELDGWAFKIKNDPRVTRVGRLLRRFSLDELPQLWNVLKGDMSLVGPRPALPDEVAKFHLWERRRLSMKPGITGLWQVSGRTRLPSEQWVLRDLEYIDTWSLRLDIKIILKTLWVVLRGQGL